MSFKPKPCTQIQNIHRIYTDLKRFPTKRSNRLGVEIHLAAFLRSHGIGISRVSCLMMEVAWPSASKICVTSPYLGTIKDIKGCVSLLFATRKSRDAKSSSSNYRKTDNRKHHPLL